MTYNHFNELKRSFERCAAPELDKPAQNMRKQAGDWPAWMRGGIGNIAASFGGSPKPAPAANYGFGAHPESYDNTPMGGLDVYEGADTTGMPGKSGYRVQQAYNEAARDAAAKFNKPGAADMEKAGGKWIDKLTGGIPGQVLPAAGGAAAAYGIGAAGEGPTSQAIGGLGTFMMLNPAVNKMMRNRGLGKYGPETPNKMNVNQAKLLGQGEGLMRMGAGKVGLLAGINLAGQVPGAMKEWREGVTTGHQFLSNLEQQSAADKTVDLTWTDNQGNPQTFEAESSWLPDYAGSLSGQRTSKKDKFQESMLFKQLKRQVENPDYIPVNLGTGKQLTDGGRIQIVKRPNLQQQAASTLGEGKQVLEDTGEAAAILNTAAQPLAESMSQFGSNVAGAAGESKAWREDLQRGLSQAAPAGAGALGGYIASQLLGPGVKEDETPSEREKRERLQRIYNLLGVTGGGGLGYYLANRFGGKAKTASDTQSLDIIANLGRVAARDGLH